ncbi:MAG: hypothetical protein JWM88_1724 [Verrucomicrobia bacterium]|nr:hypothetical protein [Verrucomicrobiota bacterium]
MTLPLFLRPRPRETSLVIVHWVLLLGFFFRVTAQAVQRYSPVDFLPPFTAWHSGVLPYETLLFLQLLILGAMVVTDVRLALGRVVPRRATAEMLLSLGAFYFSFMLFRFGASLTFAEREPFLGSPIPAFFHLVLSGWLIALGMYHYLNSEGRNPDRSPPQAGRTALVWLTYPIVIAIGLWLHLFLLGKGVGLQASTYVPLALAAAAIAGGERWYPYRGEWQPGGNEVRSDLTFMVIVQILLPKMLTFFVTIKVVGWLQANGVVLQGFWPHGLHPLMQALLMILLVDFMRYWLHRASHEWSPALWRLHAVHHSPHKLYWVNVARFHPIEKSLQFLLDAAPFMILGVSPEVIALYFICYSINGFFQHSNVELRLGWMNYLLAGPELHRWHHSWESRESNRNYGNNIILWDLVFGSFFLPGGREVGQLGLRNRDYPRSFLRQMRTPFIKGADQPAE